MNTTKIIMFAGLAFLALSGCVGQEAFTKSARTGDTVALALGGSPSHELNAGVDKDAMSVSIKDSAGITYPVKLRHLMKLYPDPTSKLNYSATYEYDVGIHTSRFYRQPNQGEWIAVIDLVDPATDVPLPLIPGPATIAVTTPDLVDGKPVFGVNAADGNLKSIKIEIIDGIGSVHGFNPLGGGPGELELLPQLEISFDNSQITDDFVDTASATKAQAVSFTIDFDESYFSFGSYPPMVRGNINDPRISVLSALINDAGNIKINVIALVAERNIVLNPDPLNVQDESVSGRKSSKIGDLRVFVTWAPARLLQPIDDTNVNTVFQITNVLAVTKDGATLLATDGSSLISPVASFRN